MGKTFTYDFSKYPHEAPQFSKRMRAVGMKNVRQTGNKVTFFDPRPMFDKSKMSTSTRKLIKQSESAY